jgi:hypothetical protein
MGFPQNRQRISTEVNKSNEEFSPWFPSFASVHIGIEPGRTSLRSEATARQGPALHRIFCDLCG